MSQLSTFSRVALCAPVSLNAFELRISHLRDPDYCPCPCCVCPTRTRYLIDGFRHDFAAHPNYNYSWIFHVMVKTELPEFTCRFPRRIHDDSTTHVEFAGPEDSSSWPGEVRQDCPASGFLFAMAFDPFFRWLHDAIIPRNPGGLDFLQPALCAYADDLAVAAPSFQNLMTALAPPFQTVVMADFGQSNFGQSIFGSSIFVCVVVCVCCRVCCRCVCCRCVVVVVSSSLCRRRCVVVVVSSSLCRRRCVVVVVSSSLCRRRRCVVVVVVVSSLCRRCVVVVSSLCRRCVVVVSSLCRRCVVVVCCCVWAILKMSGFTPY